MNKAKADLSADNATAHPSFERLREGVARIDAQAGGALDVYAFNAVAGVELLAASFLGDGHATKLLRVTTLTIERVRQAAMKRQPILCLSCPRSVRQIDSSVMIGIVAAAADDATDAIGFVLCGRCSSSAIRNKKIADGLKRIWPDARPIVVTHQDAGRA